MSDFARFLPLSLRGRVDESSVTNDWRLPLADTVVEAARILGDDAEGRLRFAADAGLSAELAADGDLAALAAAIRTGKRRRIRALADAVRALLRSADARGTHETLSPAVYGPSHCGPRARPRGTAGPS